MLTTLLGRREKGKDWNEWWMERWKDGGTVSTLGVVVVLYINLLVGGN